MNNEPYGWVKNGEYVLYIEKPDSVFNYIPLYTHPAELTAEEINQVAKDCKWDYDEINIVDFAKAILRKAQEK